MIAVDARRFLLLLLHVDGMDGWGGGDVGEGNLDPILDRIQEQNHQVRHNTERQFASLVPPGSGFPVLHLDSGRSSLAACCCGRCCCRRRLQKSGRLKQEMLMVGKEKKGSNFRFWRDLFLVM
jgi:hypothetical protein